MEARRSRKPEKRCAPTLKRSWRDRSKKETTGAFALRLLGNSYSSVAASGDLDSAAARTYGLDATRALSLTSPRPLKDGNQMDWLWNNKEWLFQGLGALAVAGLFGLGIRYLTRKSGHTTQSQQGGNNSTLYQAGRDVRVDSKESKQEKKRTH